MQVNELKSHLSRFHIKPSKKLGQNFLLSEEVLDQIIAAAELSKQDNVLEIGPGLGALTRRLADKAGKVIAVEKDRKLYAALKKMFKNKNNIKIVHGDALFLKPTDYSLQATHYKLVANIPYYLTGKLIQKFLVSDSNIRIASELSESPLPNPPHKGEGIHQEHSDAIRIYSDRLSKPSLMVLLLQKEVAERIVSKKGSLLSLSVQFYADAEIVSVVRKENFYPVPEVDSAVIKIKLLDKPRIYISDPDAPVGAGEKIFFQLLKVGFSNKRKQLHNNLQAMPTKELKNKITKERFIGSSVHALDWKALLSSLGFNPNCRAEDLTLEDWVKLYHALSF